MRILGIDPSSSITGVALVEDGVLMLTEAWTRPKVGSAPARLFEFYDWLRGVAAGLSPDIACVEFLSVERNAATTRVVSHYQAASVLACKEVGMMVIEARVSSARKYVLGNGGMAKVDVFKEIRQRYPSHDFGRADLGGYDKADALVLALAAPALVEA